MHTLSFLHQHPVSYRPVTSAPTHYYNPYSHFNTSIYIHLTRQHAGWLINYRIKSGYPSPVPSLWHAASTHTQIRIQLWVGTHAWLSASTGRDERLLAASGLSLDLDVKVVDPRAHVHTAHWVEVAHSIVGSHSSLAHPTPARGLGFGGSQVSSGRAVVRRP